MTIIELLLQLLLAILTIFGVDGDAELHEDLSLTLTVDTATVEGCWQLGGPCDPTPWPDHQPGDH